MMQDLFGAPQPFQPLAARMRPQSFSEYFGQSHLLSAGKPLRSALEQDLLHSMILWGPPGVGKTSLAQLIAKTSNAHFISVSAIMSGVKEVRIAVEQAQQNHLSGRRTVLFLDEAHRFNKAQQDAFLPHIENGTLVFIGATTENPSFELNNALLSRCRVYRLKALEHEELAQLVEQALSDTERGLAINNVSIDDDAKQLLIHSAAGDSRRLYNYLEIAADFVASESEMTNQDAQNATASQNTEPKATIKKEHIEEVIGETVRQFDKGGDAFYEQISALHKSVRGSDPDAALYWFCRMLDGGCDARYIARRIVRMASEEVGNADPRALEIALNASQVQERLGSPEGELALAQAIVYVASAAKSNAVYLAYKQASRFVKDDPGHNVPVHLRNAPTRLMRELGYGVEYQYDHDHPGAFAASQSYWPDGMEPQKFYTPVERGLEIKITEKLSSLRERRRSVKKR